MKILKHHLFKIGLVLSSLFFVFPLQGTEIDFEIDVPHAYSKTTIEGRVGVSEIHDTLDVDTIEITIVFREKDYEFVEINKTGTLLENSIISTQVSGGNLKIIASGAKVSGQGDLIKFSLYAKGYLDYSKVEVSDVKFRGVQNVTYNLDNVYSWISNELKDPLEVNIVAPKTTLCIGEKMIINAEAKGGAALFQDESGRLNRNISPFT